MHANAIQQAGAASAPEAGRRRAVESGPPKGDAFLDMLSKSMQESRRAEGARSVRADKPAAETADAEAPVKAEGEYIPPSEEAAPAEPTPDEPAPVDGVEETPADEAPAEQAPAEENADQAAFEEGLRRFLAIEGALLETLLQYQRQYEAAAEHSQRPTGVDLLQSLQTNLSAVQPAAAGETPVLNALVNNLLPAESAAQASALIDRVQALVSNAMQPGSPAAQLVENALNALQGGGTSSDGKQQPVAAFLDALKQAASGKAQGGEVPQANQFVKSMAHAAPAAAQEGVGGERMTLARGIQLLQTAVAEASQMREAAKPEAGAAAKLAAPLKPGAAFAALDASLAQTNAAAPGAEAVKASAAVMTTASAETAPAASTRPVPLDSIVQTAGQTIRYSVAEGGERTFVMRLHPASLGELRIDVSHGPDGVAVKLVSANQAVREVMESQLHHLRQMLSQDGVEVARLTTSSHAGSQQQGGFSLHQGQAGADQWSNQFGQPGQPGQSGQNGRPALPGGQNAPSTGGGTSFVPRSRHDGNLNLFV